MEQHQMTELEELEQMYCEFHKDVYGVKARWYKAESVEQARADLERLQEAGNQVWAEEKKAQDAAVVRFEQRVTATIQSGAKDRETALRWIHQAEDTQGDDEFLCYNLGLPYGYFRKSS
jgi:hypothetical protein